MTTQVRQVARPLAPEWFKATVQATRWSVVGLGRLVLVGWFVVMTALLAVVSLLSDRRGPSGLLEWTTLAGRAAVSAALIGVGVVVVVAVGGWLLRVTQSALGGAVIWVIDEPEGWAAVIARRALGDRRRWIVSSLLAVPPGQYRGALVGRAVIEWADRNHFVLEATARNRELSRIYIRAGFVERRITLLRKPRLRRQPASKH